MKPAWFASVWTAIFLCAGLATTSLQDNAVGKILEHATTGVLSQKHPEHFLSRHNISTSKIRKLDISKSYARLKKPWKRKLTSKSTVHSLKSRSARDTALQKDVENSYLPSDKKIDFQNFSSLDRSHNVTEEEGEAVVKPMPVLAIAEQLGQVMERIAEDDLGITRLKRKLQQRGLVHGPSDINTTQHLDLLKEALQSRLDRYVALLVRMVVAALNTSQTNPYTRTTYNPCCLLPQHILMYEEKFGCSVNSELWCDGGYGDGSDPALVSLFSPAPSTLTRMFLSNAAELPELKWQYFMSSTGLHTEYPAHRSASPPPPGSGALLPDSTSLLCQNRGRHQAVYEASVRPRPKHLLLLFDVGRATMPRSLASFRDAGNLLLSALSPEDRVGALSVSDRVRRPKAIPCAALLQPATPQHLTKLSHFINKLSLDKMSATNHSAGMLRAMKTVESLGNEDQLLIIYLTSGAVDELITTASTYQALLPAVRSLHPRLRIAVLAADLRHLRSREYRARQQLLRCLTGMMDAVRQQDVTDATEACPDPQHRPRSRDFESHSLLLSLNTTVVSPQVLRVFDLLSPEIVPGLEDQLRKSSTTTPPFSAASGRVSFHPTIAPNYESGVRLSLPYWDSDGQGVVVSVSGAVPCGVGAAACGVVGVDVALSVVLHDIIHHYSPTAGITVVVMHHTGQVLYHPVFGDVGVWSAPVTPVSLVSVEPVVTEALQRRIVSQPTGYATGPPLHFGKSSQVWWRRLDRNARDWIIVQIRHHHGAASPVSGSVASDLSDMTEEQSSGSLPLHAIYQRLDLLPPERALVCRHFTQMATLDAPTVYVSPRALTVDGRAQMLSSEALLRREEQRIARIMRYLISLDDHFAASLFHKNTSHSTLLEHNARLSFYSDTYQLEEEEEELYASLENGVEEADRASAAYALDDDARYSRRKKPMDAGFESRTEASNQGFANPGLNIWVKDELSILYSIAEGWQRSSEDSNETIPYIIRRLGVLASGGVVEYPGFLSSPAQQDRRFYWWLERAFKPPLDVLLLLPPRLDDAGSGYILTAAAALSHSGTEAVLAADFSLGYWQRLLLTLHPLCDTTGAQLSASGVGVRCFLADESGHLVLHPGMLRPPASVATDALHLTVQEPLLSMTLLDTTTSSGASVLRKLSCRRPWRSRSERRYSLTVPAGEVVSSHSSQQPPTGKWCVWYSLAAVPGTNLIFGVVNQTCDSATAFCPCSLVDQLCLNCQFVEARACECPCECPRSSAPQCVSNDTTFRAARAGSDASSLEELCPLDPPMPSLSRRQQVGLLGELQPCHSHSCGDYVTRLSCLGRPGCEWCALTAPTNASNTVWAFLSEPRCVAHPQCPGGVKGGISPYPRGLAPQPRHNESHRTAGGRSVPLAPVLGILVGVVVVAGVGAAYCYHQHQSVMGTVTVASRPTIAGGYTSTALLASSHMTTALEEELILDCQLGPAAATMSPYRMNPAYRRPPAPGGDPSDPGYSTMTPHDEVPQRSSSSSSSCVALASVSEAQSSGRGGRQSRSGRPLWSKKRSRGLSSQPEEDCDESSSSPSGVFKGLASSSLLSGDHDPPTLDWSPEELLQYFGDLDSAHCSHCRSPIKNGVCSNCEQSEQLQPCGSHCVRNRSPCEQCTQMAPCSSCRDRPLCSCRLKKRRRSRRHAGSISDGIESDVASDTKGEADHTTSVLSSPQKIGPNQVIVPVTVHMVDSL